MTTTVKIFVTGLCAAALAMAGCEGDEGRAGPTGSDGAQGPEGSAGADGPQGPVGPGGLPLIIQLPGTNFFPEGIAMDDADNFYVGSITTGEIIQASIDGFRASVLSTGVLAANMGAVGMLADNGLGKLWVCESDLAAFAASRLVLINTGTGAMDNSHALAPESAGAALLCNDIAIDDDTGDVYATESLGGQIFKIPVANRETNDSAELWLADDVLKGPDADNPFGANGIFKLGEFLYVLNFSRGTLLRITIEANGDAGAITPVTLTDGAGDPVVINGGDGLKSIDSDTLIVVQNRANTLSVVDLTDIDQAEPKGTVTNIATRLDVPTTVEVGPDGFAYVVEGQFDHLLDPDNAGPPSLPFGIVRVDLFLSGQEPPKGLISF